MYCDCFSAALNLVAVTTSSEVILNNDMNFLIILSFTAGRRPANCKPQVYPLIFFYYYFSNFCFILCRALLMLSKWHELLEGENFHSTFCILTRNQKRIFACFYCSSLFSPSEGWELCLQIVSTLSLCRRDTRWIWQIKGGSTRYQ